MVGTDDQVQVQDWYLMELPILSEVNTNTHTLLTGQVNQLVSAMATFDVPIGVGAVISEDTRLALEPTLASAWQISA